MTPQERWWKFRGQLPVLSRWQKLGGMVLTVTFLICGLPFLIPLPGERLSATDLADANGEFITIGDTEIYYVHVAGSGETVILVHGFMGSTTLWSDVMPALQESGYDIYALDLPGYGLSEKSDGLDMSHPAAAETISGFIDRLNIDPVHLVGHSTGANVILHIAQRAPPHVRTLTLVDAVVESAVTPKIPARALQNPILRRWLRLLLRGAVPDALGDQLRGAVEEDGVVTPELEAALGRYTKTPDWELGWIGIARDGHKNGLQNSLGTVNLPVLVLWGAKDGWTPVETGSALAEALPEAEFVTFADSGHLPMLESPAQFSEALRTFWRRGQD